MAFNESLADRIRNCMQHRADVIEKKMFGGLCFMVSGNMCCGIVGDTLMARVGAEQYQTCLALPFAAEMTFTGKPMKGMVYVQPQGIVDDGELRIWVNRCLQFVDGLVAK